MYLSIIIPCYNEERRLGGNLEIKINYFKQQKYSWEMILVNDGSLDSTSKMMSNFINKYKKFNIKKIDISSNTGKGHAVKVGMLAAQGDLRLFTDSDNSTSIEQIDKIFPYAKNYSIVIASRYLKGSKIIQKQSIIRRIISRLGNLFIKLLLGFKFSDTQCGFKLFNRPAATKIFSKCKIDRWGFDVEILALAKKFNCPVIEVPVIWNDSLDSKLQPAKAAFQVFSEAMKIKKNLRDGKYDDK
ncbi:MAG: glycosyltransferase family 2 protein [Patescibacteria group bacterium]|nr:glycosyltransferase family 2 protein [Patescibacteria group bacterium]